MKNPIEISKQKLTYRVLLLSSQCSVKENKQHVEKKLKNIINNEIY